MGFPMMKAAHQTLRAWYSPDLSKHEQLIKLLETYYRVHLEDNEEYPEKLTWCLKHCSGKFRDLKHGDGMDWYFEQQEDATMFALKWL